MAAAATNWVFIALLLSLCLGMCFGQMADHDTDHQANVDHELANIITNSTHDDIINHGAAPTKEPALLDVDCDCGCGCGCDDGDWHGTPGFIDPGEVDIFGGCPFVYDCLGVTNHTTLEELKDQIRKLIDRLGDPFADGIAPVSG